MKPDAVQRTSSEGTPSATSPSPKMWRIGSALRKIQSISATREERHRLHHASSADDSHDFSSNHLRPIETNASSIHESQESSYRQLHALIQRMRSAPSGHNANHVDAAYKEFFKIKDRCSALCHAVLQEEFRQVRSLSNATETTPRRDSSMESPYSPGGLFDQRSSFSGRSLAEVVSGSNGKAAHISETGLNAVRDWKNCLETLTDAFKTSLAETYKSYERDATPEMIESLFTSKKFRREAVHRMRNASVTRVLSADPQFFPRYEIRFRNYERTKQELSDIRNLVQSGESGISPARRIDEFVVSGRGDAILEFANISPDGSGNEPVLRFRVSSHMLAETSPIFARMFNGSVNSQQLHDDEDITPHLPPPPTPYVCKDGSETKLYRMPQFELNHRKSLEILLHAAHMHNEIVPQDVTFEQLIAIAECCIRYKSTSPLESVAELKWLPQWMKQGAGDMPVGLLVISYAFGLRELFTRMSKFAILNIVDEEDLFSKPWPQRIKDKLWAVRNAKMDQIHACCTSTVQEYIRQPTHSPAKRIDPIAPAELRCDLNATSSVFQPRPANSLSSTPRCPKGSHSCDAANLGWIMLAYSEMDLLGHIVQPQLLTHLLTAQSGPRSLAQIVDALRKVPSPSSPIHPGSVCDPGPAFRAAVTDVYNSVVGLTLHDVSNKSHGWALSKHRMTEPQELQTQGLHRMAAPDKSHSVVTEFPETIRLRILSEVDELDDLHAAAMINGRFYSTYKTHELYLMRNILRADRMRTGTLRRRPVAMSSSNAEEKVLKDESDLIKERTLGEGADAMTLLSDDEEDGSDDDDASVDDTPAPSIRRGHRPGPNGVISRRQRADPPNEPADDPSSPATPRQSAHEPVKPTVVFTEDLDEPPLTDEEARRILWPDSIIEIARNVQAIPPPGVEAVREKFRLGDFRFGEGREEKTLVVTGEKQLRSEHDVQVGLLKGGRPGTSSSGEDGGGKK